MDKLQSDNSLADLEVEILLSNAVRAKNSLTDRYGFSPFQLVFGRDNRLNPIEDRNHCVGTGNEMKKMIDAMFEARIKYLKSEKEQRIKAALDHHINSKKS